MPLNSTASDSKPFIKLGDPSTAPTLNYNLPQEACYSVEGYAVIPLPAAYYAPPTKQVPVKNPWSAISALSVDKITDRIRGELISGESNLLLGAEVVKTAAAAIKIAPKVEVTTIAADGTPGVAQPAVPAGAAARLLATDANTGTTADGASIPRPMTTVVDTTRPPLAAAGQADVLIAGVPLDYVAEQAAKGRIPRLYKRFSGALAMQFVEQPPAPKPTLTLVEHYRVCSFLGNYGAGKVVQTFSLLPGERTQITIKSYKNQNSSESTTASASTSTSTENSNSSQANTSNSSVKSSSENLLDSYSEAAANEFEDIVNEEHGIESLDSSANSYYTSANTTSTTVPTTKSSGGGLKINLGIISFGGGSSTTGGGTTTQTNTAQGMTGNAARSTAISALESAVSKHVARSSKNRDVQVNTTTGSTNTAASQAALQASSTSSTGTVVTTGNASENQQATGDENLNLRELQNINLSRTLNFVFRQMQQEYVTVMYLDDISLVYSNGYPGSEQYVRLPDLDRLLASVLDTDQQRQEVRQSIQRHVCNVYDYRGQRVPFAETYVENQFNCGSNTAGQSTATYLRKRPSLGEKEVTPGNPNTEDTYGNITVPGIILSVQSHILRTDSLIVDTVLGQGEALDFYNSSLQQLAVDRAQLENSRLGAEIEHTQAESRQLANATQMDEFRRKLAEDIINQTGDPKEKADIYRKLFGDYDLEDIIKLLQELRS